MTIQSKDKALKLHKAKAIQNNQQILDKAGKKRVKALCNEAACLQLVQQGKGLTAIQNYCKKVYKEKQWKQGTTKQERDKWINGRAKIYFTIAQLHDTIIKAEQRKAEQEQNKQATTG